MLHHQQQQKQEEAVCSKEGEEASASVMNCRLSPCRNLGTILKMSSCTIKAGENVSFFSFLSLNAVPGIVLTADHNYDIWGSLDLRKLFPNYKRH